MKLILLAATLAAAPALAQTTPSTGNPSAGTTGQTYTPGPATTPPPTDASQPSTMTSPDPATATPANDPAMTQQAPDATTSAQTTGTMTAGGYQPSGPALSGTPQPGQQVVVQPSRSATEAYPPPAPLANYPVCKKGQYDKCMQRGGR